MAASNTDWNALHQAEAMACFHANHSLHSHESYTLEGRLDICNKLMGTSKAVLNTLGAFHRIIFR